MNNKKGGESPFNQYSIYGAAFSVGVVMLLMTGGSEKLSFAGVLGYSALYALFALVLACVGAVAIGVVTNGTKNKWWCWAKIVGSLVVMAYVYCQIAGRIK